jgi:hypothetical protein
MNGNVYVMPSTIEEDYSDITPVHGDRFVAGAYVGFTARVFETLGLTKTDPRATVSTTQLEVEKLP